MDCDVDGEDDEDQHVSVDCRDDDPTDQLTSERERVLINDEDLVLGRVMRLLWSGWRERLCSMMIENLKQTKKGWIFSYSGTSL